MMDTAAHDDDVVEVTFGGSTATVAPTLVSSRVAVASAASSAALGATGLRLLGRNNSFAIGYNRAFGTMGRRGTRLCATSRASLGQNHNWLQQTAIAGCQW